MTKVLDVRDLRVTFPRLDGSPVEIVKGVDLTLQRGEIMGLVGESGSGKTMVGLSLLDLLPPPGRRAATAISLNGKNLLGLRGQDLLSLRGSDIGMVFQDPMSSFNPVRTIGSMFAEVITRRHAISKEDALARAAKALGDVGVPSPEARLSAYPHQLSGGLRQRAMIALAIVNDPSLLIADEPTTALDTTIQSQILDLLKSTLGDRALLLVTHDLGVAAEICDTISVMRRGEFVEQGSAERVLQEPQADYTKRLIDAVPSFNRPYCVEPTKAKSETQAPLLSGRDLQVTFSHKGKALHAVAGIDVDLAKGETVALVGESGSGKSTLVSALIGIHEPTRGEVLFSGERMTDISPSKRKAARRRLQMVFQDPYSSLNPRWRIERILCEPMRAHNWGTRDEIKARAEELIDLVGLPRDALRRRPGQFSGGQRQRIAIARALALEPDLLIADEPVSALDVSMQAQIVALLQELKERLGVGCLIIAHDLALMHHVADRIIVMYLGKVVEEGPAGQVTTSPLHPYTAALVSGAPDPDVRVKRKKISLQGEQPSPIDPPSGCAFHTRCPIARAQCREERPPLRNIGKGRVACHFPGELSLEAG